MERYVRPCPDCGGPARVLFRTTVLDGIRLPVEPRMVCVHGHVSPLPHDLWSLREPGETPQADDEDVGSNG